MQRFSLYRAHKVYPRTDGTTHARTHGTTAALLYPHRNALRGDNNMRIVSISSLDTFLLWKLTGAKSNFESMFQQERNLNEGIDKPNSRCIWIFNSRSNNHNCCYRIGKPVLYNMRSWFKQYLFRKVNMISFEQTFSVGSSNKIRNLIWSYLLDIDEITTLVRDLRNCIYKYPKYEQY